MNLCQATAVPALVAISCQKKTKKGAGGTASKQFTPDICLVNFWGSLIDGRQGIFHIEWQEF